MGYFSTDILGNDLALDVYEIYTSQFTENGHEEAMKSLKNLADEIMGTDEEDEYWLALAYAEWKCNSLTDDVKEKLIMKFENNRTFSVSDNELFETKRRDKIKDFIEKIKNGVLPARILKTKKYKKSDVDINPWKTGDVLAYRFTSADSYQAGIKGKYILLQKVGETMGYEGETLPVLRIFNHVFSPGEDFRTFSTYPLLPNVDRKLAMGFKRKTNRLDALEEYVRLTNLSPGILSASDFPKRKVEVLFNDTNDLDMYHKLQNDSRSISGVLTSWRRFEQADIIPMLENWKGYELSENGGVKRSE